MVAALAYRPEDVPEFAGHLRTLLMLQITALGARMGIPARKRQIGAAQSAGLVSVTLRRVGINGTTTASLRQIPEL